MRRIKVFAGDRPPYALDERAWRWPSNRRPIGDPLTACGWFDVAGPMNGGFAESTEINCFGVDAADCAGGEMMSCMIHP
jgi:hypothetical protein